VSTQAQEALDLANQVRIRRGEVRAQIRALPPLEGVSVALDALTAPEPHLRTMTVYRLLTAMPRYGRARVLRVLRKASVSEGATLAALTDRQRKALRGLFHLTAPTTLDQPQGEAVVEGEAA